MGMRFLFTLFLLCYSAALVSQDLQVKSVQFSGLKRTKTKYLQQFVTINTGEKLNLDKLETDRQTLINLEILNNVTIKLDTVSQSGVGVTFQCEELQTLLPIFFFGGITDNFWARIGATESNWMGNGQKFTAYYQYNERNSFYLGYEINRINQTNWGIAASINKWSTLEPLYFDQHTTIYEYNNNSIDFNLIYNFSFRTKLKVGGALFQEKYNKENKMDMGPDNVSKDKLLGRIVLYTNQLNYEHFYQSGWRNVFNFETVTTFGEQVPFYIFFNDFSYYTRLKTRHNFASRLRLGLSTNNDSPFAPFVLDSYMNIRGAGNKVDRGTGSVVLNTEYRYTIFERKNTALQSNIFADIGSWRHPGGDFDDFVQSTSLKTFMGIGLRGIYKKAFNAILRIDYGWNVQNTEEQGFVLGIGQYF